MNKMAVLCTFALAPLWCGTSIAALASDTSIPVAPSNLNVVVLSAGKVSLSWYDNSADESGFRVQRSEDGMNWKNIGTLSANAGEYRDAGLHSDTLYMYRVFAYNGNGESQASNRETAAARAVSVPGQ